MDLKKFSAYHGGNWQEIQRKESFSQEKQAGQPWRNSGYDSEYMPIKEVVLRIPGNEIRDMVDPSAVQFLSVPDHAALLKEMEDLVDLYREMRITVHTIKDDLPMPNMLYMRDLFLATKGLTFIARPATIIRQGEEVQAARFLADLSVPLHTVQTGTFEASDALFISPDELVLGVGNRTEGPVGSELEANIPDVDVIGTFTLPKEVQHLLGTLNIVDRSTVLTRSIAPKPLLELLHNRFEEVIILPENEEVTEKQAMNVVALAPGKVLMPDDCPETRRTYENAGLNVIETDIAQMRCGAGGLACATGILSRELVKK